MQIFNSKLSDSMLYLDNSFQTFLHVCIYRINLETCIEQAFHDLYKVLGSSFLISKTLYAFNF